MFEFEDKFFIVERSRDVVELEFCWVFVDECVSVFKEEMEGRFFVIMNLEDELC